MWSSVHYTLPFVSRISFEQFCNRDPVRGRCASLALKRRLYMIGEVRWREIKRLGSSACSVQPSWLKMGTAWHRHSHQVSLQASDLLQYKHYNLFTFITGLHQHYSQSQAVEARHGTQGDDCGCIAGRPWQYLYMIYDRLDIRFWYSTI